MVSAQHSRQIFRDKRSNRDVVRFLRILCRKNIAPPNLKLPDFTFFGRGLHEINAAGDSIVLVDVNVVAEPNECLSVVDVFIHVAERNVRSRVKARRLPSVGNCINPRRELLGFLGGGHLLPKPASIFSASSSSFQNSANKSFAGVGGW
jgi:hypothetical protein